MKNKILIINSGSTSLKYKLFNADTLLELKSGYIQNIGTGKVKKYKQALKLALSEVGDLKNIKAVGHRVVHGGEEFIKTTRITKGNIKKLEKYNDLAPLHNPANLMGIKAAMELLPGIPNYASFDTAFYSDLPEKAFRYAIPDKYYKKNKIRRYGFHGLSHQYVVEQYNNPAPKTFPKPYLVRRGNKMKIISCHLGGGCSVTASIGGKAIDTSMGFTPMEGLMMMSRSGDIDPGAVTYLQKKNKLSPDKINNILNFESGVKAICGETDWRKVISKMKKGNKKAKLAFKMFCYRVQKYIGAYYAALGGLDALVFTGSIGSGDPVTRRKVCNKLSFLKNVKVTAMKTNEELLIFREVLKNIK